MGRSPRAVATRLPVSRAESGQDSRTARRRRRSTFQPQACRRRKPRPEPAVVTAARPREAEAARRTDRRRGSRRRQANRSRRRARELFAKSRKIVANSRCALCSLFSLSLVAATTAHRRTRPRKKPRCSDRARKERGSIGTAALLLGPSLGVSRKSEQERRQGAWCRGKSRNQYV